MPTSGDVDDAAVSVADCVERIHCWEPLIEAWAHVDAGPCVSATDNVSRDKGNASGLRGVPFGVKDVIDVRGQPTRFGSRAFDVVEPAGDDAPIVAALRSAGAIPVGKTRSTEFAFVDPTITRNPYNSRRSPGGSSSGSGAVVGAGIVPFALGTQTAGSLCRPAAYCGAASYKPGLGVMPVTGMAPLSPSFDAIGVIAQSADWLERVFQVLARAFQVPRCSDTPGRALRIGFVDVPEQRPSPSVASAMAYAIRQFETAGHCIDITATPISFADVIRHHRVVMLAEAAGVLLPFVGARRDLLQPFLREGLAEGEKITPVERQDSIEWIATVRAEFWRHFHLFDLLLSFPVPDIAPIGLSTTGDQTYLTPWTALGGPLVSLPAGRGPEGMPLGILLAAAPGRDAFLVQTATQMAAHLPKIARAEPRGVEI